MVDEGLLLVQGLLEVDLELVANIGILLIVILDAILLEGTAVFNPLLQFGSRLEGSLHVRVLQEQSFVHGLEEGRHGGR